MAEQLRVERVHVDSIKPHPRNARIHTEDNIRRIMRSLDEFGQRTPIVVGRGKYVLKGCGTLEAARRLGWKQIQIVKVLHLSEKQELAYALADNKTSDTSEFDYQEVSEIMKFLQQEGLDLEATGFMDFETQPLIEGEFNPGKPGKMPGHPDDERLAVKFEGEQVAIIVKALELAEKRWGGSHGKSPSNLLTEICRQFCPVVKKTRKIK